MSNNDRKPSGLFDAVRLHTQAAREHLEGTAPTDDERPTDPAPSPLCGRLPLTPTLAPCELDTGHVGPCRHRAIVRPRASESQQMREVRHNHEQTRDALANMNETLRPDDHHGWMLHKILERLCDKAQTDEIIVERLGRIESALRDEREARLSDRRRIEALEGLTEGATIGGPDG